MSGRQAKYCTDRDRVRWILLEGVINRKTQQDSPTEGKDLPVGQIRKMEKTTVKRVRRSPLAWPATYAGLALLALTVWIASFSWLAALPSLLLALAALYWGVKRIPGEAVIYDAYQIVAPGTTPEEWLIIGSHAEVQGFVEGLRLELEESWREQAAPKN